MAQISIAILVDQGKVLLGKRATHEATYANCWDFIGDHVEAGETTEEALIRETVEEVGVRPVTPEFLESTVDHAIDAADPPTYHLYVVKAWSGGASRLANNEHSQICWFTLSDLEVLEPLADRAYLDIAKRALALGSHEG